ncbi:YecR family lipoprotein [Phaeovulum sp.]|uniref:YecR family lipoprotein n=1 Tax=Phaeovulum sp. TaxID=2934796 RepID=UPI0039E64B08
MKKIMILTLGILALSGCEVQRDALPIGGSRADGTVEMGYTESSLEVSKVDWEQALRSATKRCNAWGYRRADPFEGSRRTCLTGGYGGCDVYNVTKTYQCTN